MNIILIEQNEITGNSVSLHDRRAAHIIKILKPNLGDSLRVGIIDGPKATATLTRVVDKSVVLALEINDSRPIRPETDLIMALPRPIMLKRVLTQATTLGIGRIFLINAKRVEKSFFNASLLQEENYRQYLLNGLEQAIDTIIPKIHITNKFKPFMEDYLPAKLADYHLRLLAHPNTSENLWQQAPPPVQGRALLAIGPEGGWIDYEIDKFKDLGFAPFTLGPRILRVDTAVPAILAQLDLLRKIE